MWRGRVIVGMALLALVGCGGDDERTRTERIPPLPDDAVAVVGDEAIPRDRLDKAVRLVLASGAHGRVLATTYPDSVACGERLHATRARVRDASGVSIEGSGGLAAHCDATFERAQADVMDVLVRGAIAAQVAREQGIELSPAEIDDLRRDLGTLRNRADQRAAGVSGAEMLELARRGAILSRFEDRIRRAATPEVTPQAVARYFVEHPEQFRLPDRRRIRFLVAGDERGARAAHAALRDGADWSSVVERYAQPGGTSRKRGGRPLWFSKPPEMDQTDRLLFSAPTGRLVGPDRIDTGWIVFEVIDEDPGGGESFADVRADVELALRQQAQAKGAAALNAAFAKWRPRIRCRAGHVVSLCAGSPLDSRRTQP